MKKCSTCKKEKELSEFTKDSTKKDGLKINCSDCVKNYAKEYYTKNREKEKLRGLEYDRNNRNIRRKWKNKYYEENKDVINERMKELRKINKEYLHKKRMSNKSKRTMETIGNCIRYSLKNINTKKTSRTFEIVGCSSSELKLYLESKFEPWMTWDNWGKYDGQLNTSWDIDHIIPISIAKTEEEILKLNHYTNLQPLCSYNNRFIKRDNI